jgi:hypothetical protein
MKMRKLSFLLTAAFILICIPSSYGQNIYELPYKPLDKEFLDFTKTLKEVDETDYQKSIDLCTEALDKFQDMNIRNNMIFWELSFHYASLKQYDKCFEILKSGQDEGLFYYTRTGDRVFPPYLEELEKLDGYETFMAKNAELKDAANQHKTTEFMVQLPTNYDKNKHYPLMLIMHGGIGNIPNSQYKYQSEKLQKDFIVAYTQGDTYMGSFSRVYDHENWNARLVNVYQQIISTYAVDTTQVILAGPSAGGYRSLILGLYNEIPAKGLLLSFAVYPRDLDSTLFVNSAERGLKVALLCGEDDWAIQQQKKLGYQLDQFGIRNRFVVFPETGHEFPENWSYYLDTSVDFILNDDENK